MGRDAGSSHRALAPQARNTGDRPRQPLGRRYEFVQVDVFTEHVFGGNPLAVFFDAEGLTKELMQSLAREMNLSETTFVLQADHPDDVARVRIFTPGQELPFAGHPTIGTAYVLSTRGSVTRPTFSLQEQVGRIPITIEGDPRQPGVIWMEQPLPTLGEPLTNRVQIAHRLAIDVSDLLDVPIRIASAGVPFLFVGLRTKQTVDRVWLADRDLRNLDGKPEAQGVFVFAPEDGDRNGVYTRMLGSHRLGIVEDPATGGASGPLGAILAQDGVVDRKGEVEIVSHQGVAMGRPSRVLIRLSHDQGRLSGVLVGGRVVPVLEGVVTL